MPYTDYAVCLARDLLLKIAYVEAYVKLIALFGSRILKDCSSLLYRIVRFSVLYGFIQPGREDINMAEKQKHQLLSTFHFGGVAQHGNPNTVTVTVIIFHYSSDPRG